MVEKNLNPEAKRRRLETEQKATFDEDMARVRAAIYNQNSEGGSASSGDGGSSVENSKTEDGETRLQPFSEQQPAMNAVTGNSNRRDSDDKEGGNWLKNFTSRHTRIGADYQVIDLPLPTCYRKVSNWTFGNDF